MSKEKNTNATPETEKTKVLPAISDKDTNQAKEIQDEKPENGGKIENGNRAEKASKDALKPDEKEKKPKKEKPIRIRKNRKIYKKLIKWFIILAIAGLVVAVWKVPKFYDFAQKYIPFLPSKSVATSAVGYTLEPVIRRDISETLTGSGVLKAIDSYTVTAKVTGEILFADFEEMDQVQEGQVLYVVESTDLDNSIKDQQDAVDEAQDKLNDLLDDYEDLNLYSNLTGMVSEVFVEEGDTVGKDTKIATVFDNKTMLLKIPFFKIDTDKLNIGALATISFDGSSETLTGTVKKISAAETINANGVAVKTVTISVANPGGISTSTTAYAKTTLSDGETVTCTDKGTFSYNVNEAITAGMAGKIERLYLEEGDYVSEGKLVLTLAPDTLDEQKKNLESALDKAKTSLKNLIEKKDDYVIKAPISGTVVKKNYKALDNIDSSNENGKTLAIIYDMSKLTFDMNIDELDLNKIEVGQAVEISSDSINDKFTGYVTKKSIVGTTSNGTTTYPVTVELDGTDLLLPGMNINATIIVKKVENALSIPVSAVARGNTVKVIRGGNTGRDAAMTEGNPETAGENQPPRWSGQRGGTTAPSASGQENFPQRPDTSGGTRTQAAPTDQNGDSAENTRRTPAFTGTPSRSAPSGSSPSGSSPSGSTAGSRNTNGRTANMPDTANIDLSKAETVPVELGISDDNYVEVLSGLSEGDIVVIENRISQGTATTSNTRIGGFGGMGAIGGAPSMTTMPRSSSGSANRQFTAPAVTR